MGAPLYWSPAGADTAQEGTPQPTTDRRSRAGSQLQVATSLLPAAEQPAKPSLRCCPTCNLCFADALLVVHAVAAGAIHIKVNRRLVCLCAIPAGDLRRSTGEVQEGM